MGINKGAPSTVNRKVISFKKSQIIFDQVTPKATNLQCLNALISSFFKSDPAAKFMLNYNELPRHWENFIQLDANDLRWTPKCPQFSSRLHSPQKRRTIDATKNNTLLNPNEDFISYKVTTVNHHLLKLPNLTVERRYRDFFVLNDILTKKYANSLIVMPYFPAKTILESRFETTHVFLRLKMLQAYLDWLLEHPILRAESALTLFLSIGGIEWKFEPGYTYNSDHVYYFTPTKSVFLAHKVALIPQFYIRRYRILPKHWYSRGRGYLQNNRWHKNTSSSNPRD